jgi:hypothetical protein
LVVRINGSTYSGARAQVELIPMESLDVKEQSYLDQGDRNDVAQLRIFPGKGAHAFEDIGISHTEERRIHVSPIVVRSWALSRESFLEGSHSDDGHYGGPDGKASEKKVTEWVGRMREGASTLEKRREMGARWDEGRVDGWR